MDAIDNIVQKSMDVMNTKLLGAYIALDTALGNPTLAYAAQSDTLLAAPDVWGKAGLGLAIGSLFTHRYKWHASALALGCVALDMGMRYC